MEEHVRCVHAHVLRASVFHRLLSLSLVFISAGKRVESDRSVAGKRIPPAEGIKDQKTESTETVAAMANPLASSRRKGAQRNRLAQ